MRNVAFLGTLTVLSAALFIQACTTREVVGVVVGEVEVRPAAANILEGDALPFTAVVRDAGGVVRERARVIWSSEPPDIVSVDENGVVTGLLRGTAVVRATYGGVAGEATVQVGATAGITVSAVSGPTTEAGGQATFTVVLDSEPASDVTLELTSSDLTEGTVSPGSLTFTPANWSTPQTVTVTGVDDDFADGNVVYTIVTSPASSADPRYHGLDPADVAVTNNDDDTAGFLVSPVSGPTTEAGGQATFTVRLTSRPTADVTIGLTSSDTSEGTLAIGSLTFTPANWSIPQTVTITGQDDALPDGNVTYSIITAPATSADPAYDGLDPANVAVTNIDDETAGITVSPPSGPTSESGTQATFTVVLNAEPEASVSIGLTSSDISEGTLSTASLTFTTQNWNVAQTVTVTGQDDDVDDDDVQYTIVLAPAASSDASYDGMKAADVTLTNVDDDTAGFVVSPISGPTTEAGGQASFTVRLTSEPTAEVSVTLTSSDVTRGTVSPGSLVFSAANWSVAQSVTVTGVDNALAEGNVVYTIHVSPATSADPKYHGLVPSDVSVTNIDDESAGITVSAANRPTTEAGGQATFTVVLNTEPTSDVTVTLSSSDPTEGTVSPSSLTFTATNWSVAQTVTVTGVDDDVDDGDIVYAIVIAPATSADPNYNGLDPGDVSVTNVDDDVAGFRVSAVSGPTTEAGGQSTFTVRLTSEPTADVTIGLSSSDVTEGTVSPASLTFTPANWSTPQSVTVTGVDDQVADGNIVYTIVTAPAVSEDPGYDGLNPEDVTVTNVDDETAGITVTPPSGPTTEAGGQATFTVALNTQPAANVTIGLSSSDLTEGTVAPASVTFTPGNWNVPQTVTVTGVDDDVDDDNVVYTIVTAPAVSSDPAYSGLNPANVNITNVDDDTAGFLVTPVNGPTTEAGGQATFTVRLTSQPTASVTIGLSSSDPTEGIVNPGSVTFGTSDWATPRTIIVTGVDDSVADGNVVYSILIGPATSADPKYSGMNPPDVSVTNLDDDVVGISVSAPSGPTTESGGQATFTVVLTAQPSASVTVGLSSSNTAEGTVSPTSLTFTTSDWNAPQTVTVTGVDDDVDDDNVVYAIVTAPAVSDDPAFDGLDAPDVSMTNVDDDTAGFTVSPINQPTTELGGTATFTIRLDSRPAADVTVAVSSSDPSEGVVIDPASGSLTFVPASWSVPQTVTVQGVDDNLADGNVVYTIVTGAAVSADPKYHGLNPADVTVTNVDNEMVGISTSPASGPTTEAGGTATFAVVLNTQPTANVTIAMQSSDEGEGVISNPPSHSLTFSPENWGTPQIVTVTGVDDEVDDGDVPYSIVLLPAVSSDLSYHGLDAANIALVNLDDDEAMLSIADVSVTEGNSGSVNATFTVTMSYPSTRTVTVSYATSNGTATAGFDYTATSGVLTFDPGDQAETFVVPVLGDLLDEDDETFAVTLSNATNAGISNGTAVGTIIDNDPLPALSISDATVTEGHSGTVNATFTVTLSPVSGRTVTVEYATADGTATAGSDYVATSGMLTFAAGVPSQQLTVAVNGDVVFEPNETFFVNLSNALNATVADGQGLGTITNDDPQPTISIDDVSVTEGNAGSTIAAFTVSLSNPSYQTITVQYASADGTATVADLDYVAASGTLTFDPGVTTRPLNVTVNGDTKLELNETFFVNLTAPTSATIADSQGVGTITNDDGQPTISINDVSVTEGNSGTTTAAFTVSLSNPSYQTITVQYATANGTATVADLDYVATSGTLTFNPGVATQPIDVTVNGDPKFEQNETFFVNLTTPTNATIADNQGVGTITNDDGVPTISIDDVGVAEGSLGTTTTATFTVSLSNPSDQAITVQYATANNTATVADLDYVATSGTLTFNPGVTTQPIDVTVNGDPKFEQDETFFVNLTAPTNATIADNQGTGTITNDDGQPTISIDDVTVQEGNVGTTPAAFTVSLSNPSYQTITVQYATANGTATAAADYLAIGLTTLTFDPGATTQPINVTVNGDWIDEGVSEAFSVSLSNASNATISDGTGTGTITDDDTAGVTVDPTDGLETSENGDTDTFTVVLDSEPTADVTIPVSSGFPREGTVSSPASGSLTFTSTNWSAPQTVTVRGGNDDVADGSREYFIRVGPAQSTDGFYQGLAADSVRVVNHDNDTAGLLVTPTAGLTTSTAGGTAQFTVELTSEPVANVTITLTSSHTTRGTVSTATLVFTTGSTSWRTPQAVTLTGQSEPGPYTITLTSESAGAPNYNGLITQVQAENVAP